MNQSIVTSRLTNKLSNRHFFNWPGSSWVVFNVRKFMRNFLARLHNLPQYKIRSKQRAKIFYGTSITPLQNTMRATTLLAVFMVALFATLFFVTSDLYANDLNSQQQQGYVVFYYFLWESLHRAFASITNLHSLMLATQPHMNDYTYTCFSCLWTTVSLE